MDLYAHILNREEKINKYINYNYGEVPRIRGVRFMLVEQKVKSPESDEEYVFNRYVGTDTIYIHTRCGDCRMGYDDEDSNYVSCGAKDWEDKYKSLFLEHITEEFDSTYCTHYFKAVINDDYKEIIEQLTHQHEDKGE